MKQLPHTYLIFLSCLILSILLTLNDHSANAQVDREPQQVNSSVDNDLDNDASDSEIEDLYDQLDKEEAAKKDKVKKDVSIKKSEDKQISTLSELSTLAPLSDIAVIQKRFLPRTKRFEFTAALMGTINNPFFTNLGAGLKLGYHFQEKLGVEVLYNFLSSSERTVTDNLKTKRNVKTETIVSPKSYMGINAKWIPIYGKTTFLNQRIVPFDFYFVGGVGMTGTDVGRNETTIHVGGGQSFALSKKMSVRWDLGWNFYQATNEVLSNGQLTEQSTNQDDLYLSLGMSFYFPEATYR